MILHTIVANGKTMVRFFTHNSVLALYFICISFCLFAETPKKIKPLSSKTVCLNMIVKDESQVIERCLSSVKGLIDYWVIVDTGSTDGTQKKIKEMMKDIPGELYERPWINFEHNRNEAIALAKGKGDYLLFIDADEQLIFNNDFSLPALDADLYLIPIKERASHVLRACLVNTRLDWKYVGVLHESVICPEAKTSVELKGVIISAEAIDGHRTQDPDKNKKDAKILEEALLKEPDNSRYRFYLAQAYWNDRDYTKALENFNKSALMGGWDQEVFWSLNSIAMCQETLGMEPSVFLKSYSMAYQYRPTRIEPLARMAAHYFKEQNYILSYIISKYAASHDLHPNDSVFVEYPIYDYILFCILADSANFIGKNEEAIEAYKQALKSKSLPEDARKTIEKIVGEQKK